MNLEEIKTELAKMPTENQDHLAAYLVHLRHQRDAELRREITARIDDKNPAHWVTLDELREKLPPSQKSLEAVCCRVNNIQVLQREMAEWEKFDDTEA